MAEAYGYDMITMRKAACGSCGFESHYAGYPACPRCGGTLTPCDYAVPQSRVTRVWRTGGGPYAVDMVAVDGHRFTVHLARGNISWAEPEVWAYPERYGITRYYCPGHGGAVCQYGACDENRYLGTLPGVRDLARA